MPHIGQFIAITTALLIHFYSLYVTLALYKFFIYLLTVMLYKKLSYCWETVRRESMPRIAEMDVEMTT